MATTKKYTRVKYDYKGTAFSAPLPPGTATLRVEGNWGGEIVIGPSGMSMRTPEGGRVRRSREEIVNFIAGGDVYIKPAKTA